MLTKEQKSHLATKRELAKWLAQGNGACLITATGEMCERLMSDNADFEVRPGRFAVRKWDDSEWHEPTADYM